MTTDTGQADTGQAERRESVRRWVREYGHPHQRRVIGPTREEPDSESTGRSIYEDTLGRAMREFKAEAPKIRGPYKKRVAEISN